MDSYSLQKIRGAALGLALTTHANHKYNEYPFSFHLFSVANKVSGLCNKYNLSQEKETILYCACLLHDILEDSDTHYSDIVRMVGEPNEITIAIADIVYNVTDELGKNRQERHDKTFPKIKPDILSRITKLSDRNCNYLHNFITKYKLIGMYAKEHDHFVKELYKDPSDLPTLIIGSEYYALRRIELELWNKLFQLHTDVCKLLERAE